MSSKHKIVLLGETGVGKTSLVSRFVNNRFTNMTESTIGGAFSTKYVDLDDNQIILNIWDTAGQERYRSISSFFYRGAVGCLCVFDVTDRKSFLMLSTWIKLFKEGNESQKYIIIIVGNKFDADKNKWQITEKEVKEYANENDCLYIFTSCFTGDNIQKTFNLLAEKINVLDVDKNTMIINSDDIEFIDQPKNSCWC